MASENDTSGSTESNALSRLETGALAALGNLSLPVSVRMGTVSLTVAELLDLEQDTVITLEQRVDEPVEVMVGDRVVALGELVSVEDDMGVRITEIVAESGGAQ